ncbi:MAG: 4'-phosphopantetheinyl transferase superfamily protein [Planctomycetales bacterium]|nr:4'-phosphopantetheinyl transferase superfamily protein [Planctomycetales bacterium]MBN8626362.1 4'-phosphopantetheinyl transferase superfamily protein [Planctomycetota bacterium]
MEVDLWFADYAALRCEELASSSDGILDTEELARRNRFVFERDRRSFAVSHVLLRRVLSRYAPLAPAEWRFDFNTWGKPRIANPNLERAVYFNLSHTRGAALVGVSYDSEIGVDIEQTERDASCVELADRYFSPTEVRALRELPSSSQQRERFFELWTLKESYIKARGMGLAIPLDQFSFSFPPGDTSSAEVTPRISFSPTLGDSPDVWQFIQRPIGASFRAAAAVRTSPGATVQFLWKQTTGDFV